MISSMPMPRVRRACERCRQKKTRCPGEKPTCSFCQRLGQSCVYLRRGVDRTTTESQRSKPKTPSLDSPPPGSDQILFQAHSQGHQAASDGSPQSASPFDNLNVAPTSAPTDQDILHHAVEVYRRRIYFQPLPLFNLNTLYEDLEFFPPFLRLAFLAITFRFADNPLQHGWKGNDIYMENSRQTAIKLALDGVSKLEVLQALCLLALCETKDGLRERARMTIGIAAQLAYIRATQLEKSEAYNEEANSRCYWSILIIQTTFTTRIPSQLLSLDLPNFPPSPQRPPPVFIQNRTDQLDIFDSNEIIGQDYGINATCLERIRIWAEVSAFIESIRTGKYPKSFTSLASCHNQLTMKMYEAESKFSYQHLFRKVAFQHRQPSEFLDNHEYWAPWLFMQVSYHAAQATLNNPFIHLVALRGSQGPSQSRVFLQETLDRALFHSAWVARMLQISEDLSIDISNLLIGQMVAATSTVPWLFQFVGDNSVAERARQDFQTCGRALGRIATYWPDLNKMYQTLKTLESTVDQKHAIVDPDRTTIQVSPAAMWQLLSTEAPPSYIGRDFSWETSPGNDSVSSVTLQVTTTIVHPAAENEQGQDDDAEISWKDNVFDEPYLTDLISSSLVADSSWLPF